ncbi:MAG: hypothetical protein LBH76_02615 [Propionibacteriaceae bacterium]|jgi:plasmid stability protein|nr:hypothetical protein [Propionibacteriaceae bacterium]
MDVLVRNVKPETRLALAEKARAHGRSLQAELLEALERAAAEPTPPPHARKLQLVMGRAADDTTWSRDEIYEGR